MRIVPAIVSLPRLLLVLALTARETAAAEFAPVFLAMHAREPVRPVGVKWEHPIYNLTGWKRADGRIVHDVFELGEVILLDRPVITRTAGTTRWTFTHEALDLEAEVVAGRLRYEFTTKKPGQWTVVPVRRSASLYKIPGSRPPGRCHPDVRPGGEQQSFDHPGQRQLHEPAVART